MKKLNIRDCEVQGKRVLARFDFNVPLDSNRNITDDTRIQAALPTIKNIVERGGRLIMMSHLGRPRGQRNPELSLTPVANRLGELISNPLRFVDDCIGEEVREKVSAMKDGELLLLENVRYYLEETDNDPGFARELATLGDIYVNDAFGTAHRAHASTAGVADYFDIRAAGFLMEKELEALGTVLQDPARPFVAVLGGAKIAGKIDLIQSLLEKVDVLLVGGGMMYTFFKASGLEIGKSICDDSFVPMCKELMAKTKEGPSKLLLPVDTIIAREIDDAAPTREASIADIPQDGRAVQVTDRRRENRILERPHGYFREAELRRGNQGDREGGRGRQSTRCEHDRGRRRQRGGYQPDGNRRPVLAHFDGGWRLAGVFGGAATARRRGALRRCGGVAGRLVGVRLSLRSKGKRSWPVES
jgi:phosphoglycerate kinase